MTKIEWADATWNPVVGCSVVSPGCTNCYAMRMADRFDAMVTAHTAKHGGDPGPLGHYEGLTKPGALCGTPARRRRPVWTGTVAQAPDHILTAPLHRAKPTRYFVNSMGDLFHENVPDDWIDRVFAVMALAPQHDFLVLTKRAKRMRTYMTGEEPFRRLHAAAALDSSIAGLLRTRRGPRTVYNLYLDAPWPLPNVWLGVSAEDQARADDRIPDLLATPAAVRFVSAEPLLGLVDLGALPFTSGDARHRQDALAGQALMHGTGVNGNPDCTIRFDEPRLPRLDWIIVGGESGPGARPMHPEWARSIRDQCVAAGVPFFFKQWGEWALTDVKTGGDLGGDMRRDNVRFVQCDREPDGHFRRGDVIMRRFGKKRAGRVLDGREWSDFPVTAQ